MCVDLKTGGGGEDGESPQGFFGVCMGHKKWLCNANRVGSPELGFVANEVCPIMKDTMGAQDAVSSFGDHLRDRADIFTSRA